MFWLLGLLIGLLLVLCYITTEHLVGSRTRILRTVGTVNDGDETPSAAGMIISMPLLDYSKTWNDGVSERSCDECPGKLWCPKCENVKATEGFDWRGIHPVNAEFIPDPLMSKTIKKWGAEYPLGGPYSGEILQDGRIYNESSYLTHGVSNQPSVDFSSGIPYYLNQDTVDSVMTYNVEGDDPDFWDSRERRGAGGQGAQSSGSKYIQSVAYLGTRNDDIFDGERALVLGTQRGTDYLPSTSVKLYNQKQNSEWLKDLQPIMTEPRILFGAQGYVYKEPGMA